MKSALLRPGFYIMCLLLVSALGPHPAIADQQDGQKAVLVTGASTGIGRAIAEELAENGYYVYAGARKQADLDALDAIENIEAVKLDVTVQEQIDTALAQVKAGGRGLFGLINNAGVFIGGPAVDVPVEEFEWLMDVNVFGVYRVTQAFAPMIISEQGRISNIGSISGTGSGRFFSHYSVSKHGIEAYTDSLAAEMEPLGVHVSVIEPGNYNSAIGESALTRMRAKSDDYLRDGSPFAEQFEAFLNRDWERSKYKDPDEVAAAALHAMSDAVPLRRYMVVPSEDEAAWTIGKQIEELVQLNQWQAWSYSREELIAMLDAVPSAENDQAELTEMLHDFLKNSAAEATHAQFWAEDLVYTSSNGTRFGKADILAGFASDTAAAAADDNALPMEFSGEDVNVQVFGTTAIVTFRLVGTPGDGSTPLEYFNSGTFLKRQGRWQAVNWQATIIPPAES
jgi:NAD(P)-dependent dehydrogenase (short-subunit alcohol dehydrogenase family)